MKWLTVLCMTLLLAAVPTAVVGAEKRIDVPLGDSPQLGPADAPITLIEFLDFQ